MDHKHYRDSIRHSPRARYTRGICNVSRQSPNLSASDDFRGRHLLLAPIVRVLSRGNPREARSRRLVKRQQAGARGLSLGWRSHLSRSRGSVHKILYKAQRTIFGLKHIIAGTWVLYGRRGEPFAVISIARLQRDGVSARIPAYPQDTREAYFPIDLDKPSYRPTAVATRLLSKVEPCSSGRYNRV